MKKNIAAVVTVYRKWSHADVIVGKVLEGFHHDGGAGPAMQIVSMYVDQFPATDMSRALARKYGFTLHDSIEKALTLGSDKLAVDGVIFVGEHGDFPQNRPGQLLFPPPRLFEA